MQAFLAILRYDLGQLTRSWVVRVWLGLLLAPALFLVAVAASEGELASETMAVYVGAVMVPISGLAVAVLASGAVSGESAIIADGILSRSVTRTEYMSAKIVARLGFTLAVYLGVMLPFSYLIIRYAAPDTSLGGVAVGLLLVAMMLLLLGAFGITLSTLLPNVLMATMTVLLTMVLSGFVFQFLGMPWMSTTAVVNNLPDTFRGETPIWDHVRIFLIFGGLMAAAVVGSIWVFRRRDI